MNVNYYKLDELVFNFCCEYVKFKILILILILDKLMGTQTKKILIYLNPELELVFIKLPAIYSS